MKTFQEWLKEYQDFGPLPSSNDGMPCRSKISAQDRPKDRPWNAAKRKFNDMPPEQHPEPEALFGFGDDSKPERVRRMSKKMNKG